MKYSTDYAKTIPQTTKTGNRSAQIFQIRLEVNISVNKDGKKF